MINEGRVAWGVCPGKQVLIRAGKHISQEAVKEAGTSPLTPQCLGTFMLIGALRQLQPAHASVPESTPGERPKPPVSAWRSCLG
jgi:hypothetical protein